APQRMDALVAFVPDGILARLRRKGPGRRHAASVGVSVFSRYSRPNPSHMITTARCGCRWANARPERSAALEARNSRRESIVSSSVRRGVYSSEKLQEQLRKNDNRLTKL